METNRASALILGGCVIVAVVLWGLFSRYSMNERGVIIDRWTGRVQAAGDSLMPRPAPAAAPRPQGENFDLSDIPASPLPKR